MFFSSVEYKDIMLPFIFDENADDNYASIISLEAYGEIEGEYKYLYASYDVNAEIIDEMIEVVKGATDKEIKAVLKIKNQKVKSFEFDMEYLAEICNDERVKSFECLGWGINDKSVKEPTM